MKIHAFIGIANIEGTLNDAALGTGVWGEHSSTYTNVAVYPFVCPQEIVLSLSKLPLNQVILDLITDKLS